MFNLTKSVETASLQSIASRADWEQAKASVLGPNGALTQAEVPNGAILAGGTSNPNRPTLASSPR